MSDKGERRIKQVQLGKCKRIRTGGATKNRSRVDSEYEEGIVRSKKVCCQFIRFDLSLYFFICIEIPIYLLINLY